MKIPSKNSDTAKWGIPLVALIVVGCFLLGLITARFGSSAPLVQPAGKQTPSTSQPPKPQLITPQAPAPQPVTSQQPTTAFIPPKPVALKLTSARQAAPAGASSAVDREPLPPLNSPSQGEPERLDVFGQSVLGKPLKAYVLGDGANKTMIFGDFHGNERSVPDVVKCLLQYLKQHPEKWPDCKIILIPYANPDGWAAGTRVNAHQVDINRNFHGTWKSVGRTARNYPGPRPDSEPETTAIERLVDRYHPTKIVSIHQPLHMLNWTGSPGKRLASVMHKANGYPISDDVGYATPGSFGDYCGGKGIAIVTMELPNEGAPEAWAKNREALLAAINEPL